MKYFLTTAIAFVMAGATFQLLPASFLKASTTMQERQTDRDKAKKLLKDGNTAEAYLIFQRLVLDESNTDKQLSSDLTSAVNCLNQLNRIKEFDEFFEQAVALHSKNSTLLYEAAKLLGRGNVPSYGYLIGGEFERGQHRGGGIRANVDERDRIRAIQLTQQSIALFSADENATPAETANAWELLAGQIGKEAFDEAWKLQQLTNLVELPDPGEGQGSDWYGYRGRRYSQRADKGAPVDPAGQPVLHMLPESWEAAISDGERWRFALQQAVQADADRISKLDLQWAAFLVSEFGVNSAVVGNGPVVRQAKDGSPDDQAGQANLWEAHLLTDDQTIARLANGTKLLVLPEEFNHIVVLKTVMARDDDQSLKALDALITVRMNRHQYPAAVELLKQRRELAEGDVAKKSIQDRIDQIVDNWVQLQNVNLQPAGTAATFEIRYRNGQQIQFEAKKVDIEALLADVKAYLQSNPQERDYQKTQIENVGLQLLQSNFKKYLTEESQQWDLKLDPAADHFDTVTTVETPLDKAGAWYVTAKIADGNEARMVMWIADTAITRKRIEQGTMYFVSDAVDGSPIADANLEFFGWQQQRVGTSRQYQVLTSRFAARTDDDGMAIPDRSQLNRRMSWMTIVRTADGRFAYDGFDGVWNPQKLNTFSYSPVKVYSITDRPVYRPEHKVQFRMWVRQPRFSQDNAIYANQKFVVQIRNPKGDIVQEKDVTTDRWGGVDGSYQLADEAALGRYRLTIGNRRTRTRTRTVNGVRKKVTEDYVNSIGGGSFVVEEYRKPEFEVIVDAPSKPVQLGDKIQAKVTAKYYFGAPVTEAKLHYKVERTKKDSRWYPVARWDWLYSPGYWWFAPEYNWYPGFSRWGCMSPIPFWRNWTPDPPEIVAEGDADLGPDGTYLIDIDTANALKQHSDSDHNYSITAEVVDKSRREITGSGSVLVAREPFRVFTWTNRGHYRTGENVTVNAQARTAAGKPVAGDAVVTLYSVTYEDGQPSEQPVDSWNLATGEDGRLAHKMVIPQAGQFRVSVKVTAESGMADAAEKQMHTAEGGYMLFVNGPGEDGGGYRFNALELITDKKEYSPGDSVRLQINTDQVNSTVLLFVRPQNGLCPKPQVIRLDGKSTIYELKIERDDMPNIFVEAMTIADGKLHSELKEIVVPPVQKIANVEVLPSSDRYRPGAEATVKLKLTDLDGQPFVGNTVLSVYDASLEYIAASRIPEIKSFFWNVRRRHNLNSGTTLVRIGSPFFLPNEIGMQGLAGSNPASGLGWGGMNHFYSGAPEMMFRGRGRSGGFGGGGGGFGRGMVAPSAAPMMMMEAADGDSMADSMAVLRKSSVAPAKAATVEPTVRSNFADTAYWVASVTSDEDGIVEVKFKVPDNLTTWKIKAWTLGDGTTVGSGDSEIISSKDLIIRPQTPRFFTESDLITLSAVVHNYLDTAKTTTVMLETEGGQLQLLSDESQQVTIPAGGEVRVDWNVSVVASGEAKVRMKALTDEESDASELMVPCQVHGILKTESFTGVIKPDQSSASIDVNVPAERIEEQSRLEIRYSPSLAGAMVDALPYLLEYPYGCTEQTLNRFLPAAITQQTLKNMGLSLEEIQAKRTNLNAQELGDPAKRAEQWKRYDSNPVFDQAAMQKIVTKGVTDLTNMQLSDGGWGWFSGTGERSSAHLTAQVVHGLTIAQANGVPVLPDVIQKGVQWLKNYQEVELRKLKEGDWRKAHPERLEGRKKKHKTSASNLDAFVAWVLSEHDGHDAKMSDYLYRDRLNLSAYSQALIGLVFHQQQSLERRDMVLRNIEQFLVQDDENQTAWLRTKQIYWWSWYGSENEGMARYMQLLLKVNPKNPVAPRLVKYLLNNRKHGTYWTSTRDTAVVVEAMADYIKATGEDKPDMTIEVLVDGQLQKRVKVTGETLFSFDNVVLLEGDAVKTGAHQIELRKTGTGPLYFNAYLTNFTKEDFITATGLEVKVRRKFYRLERDDEEVNVQGDRGQVVSQQTQKYTRVPLENLASVTSGDLVEVELLIDSKNDYEYLLLEDLKPSGFETVDKRSGYVWNGLRAYRELRDNRVSFFLTNLARGNHSLTYRLQAETPSQKVSALPAKIEGMYAPELVGNSDEMKFRVQDREE
ncbi:MAG: MG2 domain-containing protein [Fuerstiella sp.]